MTERCSGAVRRGTGDTRGTTTATTKRTTGIAPRAMSSSALLSLLLALAVGGSFHAGPASARTAAAAHPARKSSALDDRVEVLTKALSLDAKQQLTLKAILQSQREQVAKIWNDPAVPAAERIHATQTVSDRTADRIRAMLNDEQKKKYNPPKLSQPSASASGKPGVEDWMKATQPK